MTKQARSTLFTGAAFLFANAFFFGAILLSSSDFNKFQVFAARVVIVSMFYFAANGLLAAFTSRLTANREGIIYHKLWGQRSFRWEEFIGYAVRKNRLHVYFFTGPLTFLQKLGEFFFSNPNDIPLSNFIDGWELPATWESDPVLRSFAFIIHARQEAMREEEEDYGEEDIEEEEAEQEE